MKFYKVDLDYESWLFEKNYDELSASSKKIISEFEYVFFLINREEAILKNVKDYDTKYLEQLKLLGFSIPSFNPQATTFSYWWGLRNDKELEKKLNSKITSAEIAKKHGWGFFSGAIVNDITQLKSHLKLYPQIKKWIIKHPHSFSGIGHYLFSTNEIKEEELSSYLHEDVLLEPVYERIFDLGTTFIVEQGKIKNFFIVENFNSQKGTFRGGAGASSVDKFKKYIKHKYDYELAELIVTMNKIANLYLEAGATGNIQIDSFVYQENDCFKLYPLVEVNYRKTMGLVIDSLANKFPEADFLEWRIFTKKELKSSSLDSHWVRISPLGGHFQSFFKPMYLS